MKYHNNKVYFSCSPNVKFTLVNGTYKISNCCVTDGQDPKRNIKPDNIYNFSSDGEMSFRLGRKGSVGVADWLNEKIMIDNSTFGHSSGELNFAFIGILRLKFKNFPSSGMNTTIEFKDIVVAQGHTVGKNNWWFGGRNCFNTNDNNCVHAIGRADDGSYYCAMIRRGGNDANLYEIKSVEKIQPNWMEKIDGNLMLSQLSIPGTHDSGTKLVGIGAARCQNFSIRAQLYHGIRFFDIRLKYKENSLKLFHGGFGCDLDFTQVLKWCSQYLKEFKDETILMSVKSEGGDICDAFTKIMNNYKKIFLQIKTIPTLRESRGKIVLFSRLNFTDNGIQLNDSWEVNKQFTISTDDYTFEIEDHYNTNKSEKFDQIQKNIDNSIKDKDSSHYYLTFSSLAHISDTPYGHSKEINKNLLQYLKKQTGQEKVGTILMDYYNNHGELGENKLIETIISRN